MPVDFIYGNGTILSHPIFIEAILPFLLIFAVVFAILQKSRILGEGKKQIDAIVALVIGLIAIAFGQAIGIILQLIPFLAVSLVILLVLMLIIGLGNKEGDWDNAFKGLRLPIMIVAIVAVTIAVMIITGFWDYVYDWWYGPGSDSNLMTNIIFIAFIIGAIAAVVWGGGKTKDKGDKKD